MVKRKQEVEKHWHWTLMLVLVVLTYIRPQDWLVTALAPLRLVGIIGVVAVFVFLSLPKNYLKEEAAPKLAIAFLCLVSFSVVYAVNTRGTFNIALGLFWALFGFSFLFCGVVTSKEKLFKFFNFWVVVNAILSGVVIKNGGVGTGSFLYDENDVALAINMAIPYAAYMGFAPNSGAWTKWINRISLVVMVAAVGVSASRGGVVGMATMVLVAVITSKKPIRNLMAMGVAGVIGLAILLQYLPDKYVADMENISNPKDNTRDERLWSWSIGWEMYKRNPVWGVAAGNYQWTNHLYAQFSPMYNPNRRIMGGRAAHSLYFTLLPELGTIGTVLYLTILAKLYGYYRRILKAAAQLTDPSPDVRAIVFLNRAMFMSAIGFLVSGAFISVLYYEPFWHLLGFMVGLYRIAKIEIPGLNSTVKNNRAKRV